MSERSERIDEKCFRDAICNFLLDAKIRYNMGITGMILCEAIADQVDEYEDIEPVVIILREALKSLEGYK